VVYPHDAAVAGGNWLKLVGAQGEPARTLIRISIPTPPEGGLFT